jgi:ubiquinone/menaquinone biosynthesis C-methylase UbiE
MTTTFDSLADAYDDGRIGYSNELYDMLVEYGLSPNAHVLDVACGTGLASRPLIENGFRVTGVDVSEPMLAKARASLPGATWIAGSAEELPFRDREFDAAISAQAFHHVDATKAIDELIRVVRPDGTIAIWWKLLIHEDPVKMIRDQVAADLGFEQPPSGLGRGFREFYAAPLTDHKLRVIPWATAMKLDTYMVYERSRKIVGDTFGTQREAYFEALEQRLREKFGSETAWLPLNYSQILYLARTPG